MAKLSAVISMECGQDLSAVTDEASLPNGCVLCHALLWRGQCTSCGSLDTDIRFGWQTQRYTNNTTNFAMKQIYRMRSCFDAAQLALRAEHALPATATISSVHWYECQHCPRPPPGTGHRIYALMSLYQSRDTYTLCAHLASRSFHQTCAFAPAPVVN